MHPCTQKIQMGKDVCFNFHKCFRIRNRTTIRELCVRVRVRVCFFSCLVSCPPLRSRMDGPLFSKVSSILDSSLKHLTLITQVYYTYCRYLPYRRLYCQLNTQTKQSHRNQNVCILMLEQRNREIQRASMTMRMLKQTNDKDIT